MAPRRCRASYTTISPPKPLVDEVRRFAVGGCRSRADLILEEIARYNEVDCKVMMEILRYLRRNH